MNILDAEQLFSAATPRERQLLISTALLSPLRKLEVEALTGTDEAWSYLERLAEAGQGVQRSLQMPGALEYEPALQDYLLARLQDSISPREQAMLAHRADALLSAEPNLPWLGGASLMRASLGLRRGDHELCRRLLTESFAAPGNQTLIAAACRAFPAAAAELCHEALVAGIAVSSVRRLIERHRLHAPGNAGREWPWRFKVHVLGRFQFLKDDAPIEFSRRTQAKPLELLQALVAFGGTEVSAGSLTDALWPDSDGDAAYRALESALHRLRALLGAGDAVRMADSKLSLDRRQFWVDMWEFEREIKCYGRSDAELVQRFARARELYTGHFLEQETEKTWTLAPRQVMRERFLRCIREEARMYERRREWGEAARIYQTALELDVLAEDLYRGLMVCHRERGEYSAALQTYRSLKDLLTRYLGIPPNAKTQSLYQSIKEGAIRQAELAGKSGREHSLWPAAALLRGQFSAQSAGA
jgi:DNA-binding SARP family transcriptional activator